MSDAEPSHCARCGAQASGKFCTACGAPMGHPLCVSCGTAMAAGNAFCVHCGAAASGPATGGSAFTPWRVVAVLGMLVAIVVIWVVKRPGGDATREATITTGAAPAARAPDISNLSPREQFGRLADKIEGAMAGGDSATVVRFFPMAEQAFANLSDTDRDNDARFHMGLLQIGVGRPFAALAQADTLNAKAPKHLLASYIRAIVGDLQGDTAGAAKARRAFRENFAAEVGTNRSEYQVHRDTLDQFLATIPAGGVK